MAGAPGSLDGFPPIPASQSGAPLRPLPWRLGEPPPPPPHDRPHPLVLLIDRRAPLAPADHAVALASLSVAERGRHATYRRPADQERFLLGRAALRQLLGCWLERPAAAVAILVGPHGKPHCRGAPAFNLSHSGDLILLAFHSGAEVGVDVQLEQPDLDWRPIAHRVLPPAAVGALEALPEAEQARGFLLAWCRLEARLKASGEGLTGLERLRRLEMAEAGSSAAGVWDVAVPPGYGAAVALAGRLMDPAAAAAGAGRPSPPG